MGEVEDFIFCDEAGDDSVETVAAASQRDPEIVLFLRGILQKCKEFILREQMFTNLIEILYLFYIYRNSNI